MNKREKIVTIDKILEKIRSKTRPEWKEYALSIYGRSRHWIQENGELGLLFGFAAGVLLVIAAKLVFWMFILVGIAAGMVWGLSEPGSTTNVDDDSSEK